MMKRIHRLGWCGALALTGCQTAGSEGDPYGDPSLQLARWSLVADDTLALRDPVRGGPGYPNPHECDTLVVAAGLDGVLCGYCESGGKVASTTCGGPAAGIPYLVAPEVDDDALALSIVDLFGAEVMRIEGLTNTCVVSKQGNDFGTSCAICADPSGRVVSNGCQEGQVMIEVNDCTRAGAERYLQKLDAKLLALGVPRFEMSVELLLNRPLEDDDWARIVQSNGVCEIFADDELEEPDGDYWRDEGRLRCGHLGEDTFALGCWEAAPDCEGSRTDYELGLLLGYQGWVAGWESWEGDGERAEQDESNELPEATAGSTSAGGTDGCDESVCPPFDGTTGESGDPPAGDTEGPPGGDTGGSGESGGTTGEPPGEPPECSGSPLVLALDRGIALSSVDDGVAFDLLGSGISVRTGWVREGALLALDLDGDGEIGSGAELFGEGTRLLDGRKATDGFAALQQYDEAVRGGNEDGRIDAHDAVYDRLWVWKDEGADGVSRPSELVGLREAGVESIDLTASAMSAAPVRMDAAGHEVGLYGAAMRDDGSTIEVVDVWFDYAAKD